MDKKGIFSGGAIDSIWEKIFHPLRARKNTVNQSTRNEDLQRIAMLIERGSFTRYK